MARSSVRPLLALAMAVRGLRRAPSSSGVAIAVLALGIALPATFFSFLVGAVRPLPVPDGDRVVRIDVVQPSSGGRPIVVTQADVRALQGAPGLTALGGSRTFGGTLVDPERAASRVYGAAVSAEALELLQVAPLLGRLPHPEDVGGVALGHELWTEMYDSDPGVLGRGVRLDGVPRTVVAVMPPGFGFPYNQNLWVPLDPADTEPLELVARLAPGGSQEAAAAALSTRWSGRDAARPAEDVGGRVRVRNYTGSRGERGEAVAFAGLVLVALCLLVIACANVANLLLVRATERVRALGIQAALGASRAQIGAQLLLEALLVAVAGGAAGLGLAWLAVGAVENTLAADHFGYFWMRLAVDGRVLAFTGVLVVGTALLAGILPVVRVLRVDVHRVLKEEDAGGFVGGGGGWSRWFVTAQLALSCAALVAAGLTARALAGSGDFGRGVPADEILLAALDPGDGTGTSPEDLATALPERLLAAPGARSAALALGAPGYGEPASPVEVGGVAYDRPEDRESTLWNAVTPGYVGVVDLQLRTGRALGPQDGSESAPVTVVNESFVRRFLSGADPLGRRIRLERADEETWFTVVGVVADIDMGAGERVITERAYLPLAQVEHGMVYALTRVGGDAASFASLLRNAVADIDPTVAVWDVRTLADAHAFMIRVPRTLALLAVAGGSAGLLVAAVGLYGLLSFHVRRRRRELGVRLALGADGRRLMRDVMEVALRQLVPSVVVGLALAWLAAPLLQVLLLGQDHRSPTTYAAVAGAFLVAGLAAAVVPALRAAGLDPARVLKGD